MFAVNVMSGPRLSRAYLRGMAARGWSRVIFLSSESAPNISVEMIDYGVTKTAVLGVSRATGCGSRCESADGAMMV
jgi:NAD(P)-dependent dehydrogenase (short-subunit alcohol dehydrogenase family)